MNIKAIVASLVLGSSSLAMAAPGATVTQESYNTTNVVRDHRAPVAQPVIQPIYKGWNGGRMPPVYRPVLLASGLRLPANGKTAINVGAQLGRFGALQINATGGRTFIQQVYVQFANGQWQMVRNLDRMLNGNESLTVDLDGGRRAITRVIVFGSFGNQEIGRASCRERV